MNTIEWAEEKVKELTRNIMQMINDGVDTKYATSAVLNQTALGEKYKQKILDNVARYTSQ